MATLKFAVAENAGRWLSSTDGIALSLRLLTNVSHIWLDERAGQKMLAVFTAPSLTRVDKSDDGGDTWTQLAAALPGNQGDSCIRLRSNTILVALDALVGQPIRLARSTNDGASWSTVTVDPGFLNQRLALRTFFQMDDGSILCSPHANTIAPRVYRSADDGATWTAVYTPGPGSQTGREFAVTVIPEDNIAFLMWSTDLFGNNRLDRSLDNGVTWGPVFSEAAEPEAVVECRNYIARTPLGAYRYFDAPAGASHRHWKSVNQGATWAIVTENFPIGGPGSQNGYGFGHSASRIWNMVDGSGIHRDDTPDTEPGTWGNAGFFNMFATYLAPTIIAPPGGGFDTLRAGSVGGSLRRRRRRVEEEET